MLEFEEALSEILAAVPAPTTESVSLCDASGRVLMEHLRSPIDLPIFANSAMDGYVVRSADVASAKPASPVCLRLAGKVAPGEAFTGELTAGTCIRIFTGSPLPLGADAVVMQEDARKDSDLPATVKILAAVGPGEYVRSRGEDMKCEATLAAGGDVLTAGRIGLLAAVGLTSVRVGCLPVVGLLATGSELTEPGQPLAPGCIYESNRSTLAVLLKCAGAVPKTFPLVPDTLAGTGSALANAFHQCDAVVTSGGVSVGEVDFLKRAFTQIGGELDFWKVAIKPGRPLAFGRLGPKLLFGLPGNPVSAFVTFLLLVRPALRRWQGATDVSWPT
ncbi:MAG: molybdopterin molybdotransferase MoeA, partial [Verrucomicrobia bacterium]|nr:molybdopterin molybdotransferase MoeA [Verrucomicrobiota bacterium]